MDTVDEFCPIPEFRCVDVFAILAIFPNESDDMPISTLHRFPFQNLVASRLATLRDFVLTVAVHRKTKTQDAGNEKEAPEVLSAAKASAQAEPSEQLNLLRGNPAIVGRSPLQKRTGKQTNLAVVG